MAKPKTDPVAACILRVLRAIYGPRDEYVEEDARRIARALRKAGHVGEGRR